MGWIVEAFGDGAAVMLSAWPQFTLAVVACAALCALIARAYYKRIIQSQAAEISLLKSRLSGGDDSPPRLTDMQKRKIAAVGKYPGTGPRELTVSYSVGYGDGERYAIDLATAFDEAGGWSVARGATIDEFEDARAGIILFAVNDRALTPGEDVVRQALKDAKLTFEIIGGRKRDEVQIVLQRPRKP
jgi:hypothetical protein